jgi:diaminopimelate epimerase
VSGEPFFKMCGSGNDFVFLDGRITDLTAWPPDRIARVCARGTGVGADGLVVLSPGSGAGDVRFTFFNSDGSRGEMCGNGALCATRLSVLLGLAPGPEVRLETDAGLVRGLVSPDEVTFAELLLPDVQVVRSPRIRPGPGEGHAGFAVVGVPHLVVPVGDLEQVDLPARGRELRFHSATGPAGANVNFICRNGDSWAMRTYERGVEAETLACGTGAVACATILGLRGTVGLPLAIRSRSGAVLNVSGQLDPASGGLRNPRLRGQARVVYQGTLGPDE